MLDGNLTELTVEPSGPNWAVVFPGGDHRAAVAVNTAAGVAVNAWGWVSASLIAALGAVATLMMVAIYLQIRLRRLARRRG